MNSDVPPRSRRRFLLGTAATAADTLIATCAPESEIGKADTADIPAGGGMMIDNYVVTQPEEGKFAALSNSYPYQNGRISEVSNGMMICLNHNSRFNIATCEVVAGPSCEPAGQAPLSAEGTELIVSQK